MTDILTEVMPTVSRVVEYALERVYLEYLLFLLPLLLPVDKSTSVGTYTIFVLLATVVLVILRGTLRATGPWTGGTGSGVDQGLMIGTGGTKRTGGKK